MTQKNGSICNLNRNCYHVKLPFLCKMHVWLHDNIGWYRAWHHHSARSGIHILVLAIWLLIATITIYSNLIREPGKVRADDTGLKSPTATASPNSWTNPSDAFSSNNTYASESTNNDSQGYRDFGFSVPGGATINGIEVTLEAYSQATSTVLSDNFGITDSSAVTGWTEDGSNSSGNGTVIKAASTGDNTASPDGDAFALIAGGGYICRSIDTSSVSSPLLSYYWRGDTDAEDNENGVVEYKTSGACADSVGWTNAASHELDDSNNDATEAWASNSVSVVSSNTLLIKFRSSASPNESFRIDGVSVTGTPSLTAVLNVRLSGDAGSSFTSDKTQALTGTETTYTLGSLSDFWGSAWSSTNFSDANFRLEVKLTDAGGGEIAYLDHVAVTVAYTAVSACSDSGDNDGDGWVDYPADPGCSSGADTDESNGVLFVCSDNLDNDGDSLTDGNDPKCSASTDTTETAACQDSTDNDGDGWTDYSADPGCGSVNDGDESNGFITDCADGLDNDGDGSTDGNDPGCSSAADTSELNLAVACDDDSDNDSDTFTDYPNDPGCLSMTDTDEFDAALACSNGIDDDSDDATDFPDDFACDSSEDDDEGDSFAECQNGVDNDDDELIDYPDDPGCESAQDNDETNEAGNSAPTVTVPTDLAQATDGSGFVTFKTNVSDADGDETKIRVRYSTDSGSTWQRAKIASVTPLFGESTCGSVVIRNDLIFQIRRIDTDECDSVTLAITWDTKAEQPQGGSLDNEFFEDVRIRVRPEDDADPQNLGDSAETSGEPAFVIDNKKPELLSFDSTTTNGTYGPGFFGINIRATYDESLDGEDSSIVVSLNNDVLNALNTVAGSTISGTYEVGATGSDQDIADLSVSSIVEAGESVKDLFGNVQTGSSLPENNFTENDIVVDTMAPVLGETVAVPTPGTDTTPAYTFTSTEAGALGNIGDCDPVETAAIVGSNSITFNTLTPGTYGTCEIFVTDAPGNVGTLSVTSFTITAPEVVPPPPPPPAGAVPVFILQQINQQQLQQETRGQITTPTSTTTLSTLPPATPQKLQFRSPNPTEQVRIMQQMLNILYPNSFPKTAITGVYDGNRTIRILSRFLREVRLCSPAYEGCGYNAGPKTMRALFDAVARKIR